MEIIAKVITPVVLSESPAVHFVSRVFVVVVAVAVAVVVVAVAVVFVVLVVVELGFEVVVVVPLLLIAKTEVLKIVPPIVVVLDLLKLGWREQGWSLVEVHVGVVGRVVGVVLFSATLFVIVARGFAVFADG